MRIGILLAAVLPVLGQAQLKLEWAIGGISENTAQVMGVHALPNGDGLFGAMFGSDMTFDGHKFEQPKTQYPYNHVLFGRVKPNGKTKWLLEVCKSNDHATLADMSVDAGGNIWAVGTYNSKLEFSDGSSFSTRNYSAWIAKVSPDGELLVRQGIHDLNAKVHMYQIQASEDGGCFLSISYHGGTFGKENLPTADQGQFAQLVARLDQYGKPVWVTPLSGDQGAISAADMGFNSSGQVFVSGNFRYVSLPKETRVKISSVDSTEDVLRRGPGNSQILGSGSNIQGFIATLDPETGILREFEAVLSASHINIRRVLTLQDGSRILAFSNYNDFTYLGTNIEVNRINSATLLREKNGRVLWYRVYDSNGLAHIDDLALGNKCFYATVMVGSGKFKDGPVSFTVGKLWAGTVLKYNFDGNVIAGDHFEVGRLNCVSMHKDKGYTGGWFHYETKVGKDVLKVGQEGQFNLILAGIGDVIEPEDTIPDTLRIITGGLPDDIVAIDSSYTDRKMEIQHKIEVSSDEIELAFWDDQRVDGDIISVFYNGQPILENYTLSKEPRTIKLKVQTGQPNHVIMYTKDLGSIPPTTTAVRISDGKKRQKISLRSDPDTNGTIEIIFKE